jgi:pimeloyl-ACP methyl ester carboxylesterase
VIRRAPKDGPVLTRRFFLFLATLAAVSPLGCASSIPMVLPPPPAVGPAGVVFVADGAGNFQMASTTLRKVAAEEQSPLLVETFPWSHGYPRCLSDHMDYTHARAEGRLLAAQILAVRQQCPGARIYILGHSAGCSVALAAAEALPAESIERVILLAPSVSARYDLRPALAAVHEGLEVFYSRRDWYYLALVTGITGTSDRCWASASGRCGFAPHITCPEDAGLYARLHQHCWQPSDGKLGNTGGHYGPYQPEFLRQSVLPLLQPEVLTR